MLAKRLELRRTKDIATKEDIVKEYAELETLFKKYDRFDPENKKLILDKLRRLSNRIIELSQAFINSSKIDKEIEILYNKALKRLRKLSEKNDPSQSFEDTFDYERFRDTSKQNLDKLKDQYVKSIYDALTIQQANITQSLEFTQSIEKAVNKNDINLFQPKLVLFQVGQKEGNLINDVTKREFRNRYRKVKQSIEDTISKVFNTEKDKTTSTYKEAKSKINKELSQMYPDKKVTYPKVINGKTTTGSTPLDFYSEMWTQDMVTIQHSKNMVAMNREMGIDLIEYNVHPDACPICQQYKGKIYSIDGKSTKYEKLRKPPPIHPFCHCELQVPEVVFQNHFFHDGQDVEVHNEKVRNGIHKEVEDYINDNSRGINAEKHHFYKHSKDFGLIKAIKEDTTGITKYYYKNIYLGELPKGIKSRDNVVENEDIRVKEIIKKLKKKYTKMNKDFLENSLQQKETRIFIGENKSLLEQKLLFYNNKVMVIGEQDEKIVTWYEKTTKGELEFTGFKIKKELTLF